MGVVLLDPSAPRTASGLQIVTYGRTIAYRCRSCLAAFYEHEERAWIKHTKHCFRTNEERVRDENDLAHQMPGLFGPEAGDVERKAFMRERHGWRV